MHSNRKSPQAQESIPVFGILKILPDGAGILLDPMRSFRPQPTDPYVPARVIREFGLEEGASVAGNARRGRKGYELFSVDLVGGMTPEAFRDRIRYTELVAVDPTERFRIGETGDISMRAVELLAPIGKGTRGLIVSPPKAGKTILLEKLANAFRACEPEARILVILVDERPEEVTQFQRAVDAEVLASSNDQDARAHVALAELAMAHIRTELECGRDVVVLLDSITRMARAFNNRTAGRGRTLSGGLEAGSMEIPRRFFGLARRAEGGGSVTILATALVDTGSRMDQLIFEEFKGTGNCEITLDRLLSESRIFPAIHIAQTGTRKEDRLFNAQDMLGLNRLRRRLADHRPKEAMELLLMHLDKFSTNEALLKALAQS